MLNAPEVSTSDANASSTFTNVFIYVNPFRREDSAYFRYG